MIQRYAAAGLLACGLLLGLPGPSRGGVTFSLKPSGQSATSARFSVNLTFSGQPGDTIDSVQLNVAASDARLTADGADYDRFTFDPDPSFDSTGAFSEFGSILLFPPDPGDPLAPSATPYNLGLLSVDLTGLEGVDGLRVSLVGGEVPFQTDANGTLNGEPGQSYRDAGLVTFAEPNGVPINPVPEPATLIHGALGLLISALPVGRRLLRRGGLRAA